MKPIFVLGAGAQKGGTTWLYRQLQKQSSINLGFCKEYHIWDDRYLQTGGNFKKTATKEENAVDAFRRMMQTEDGLYERYFRSLISNSVFITGDFTPSYAMLNAAQFSEIRERMEAVGFDVRALFLMRDPVERVWSALRMHRRQEKRKTGNNTSDGRLLELFKEHYSVPGQVERTLYHKTIQSLRDSFPEESIYFGFYENIFNESSINKLSNFLNVAISGVDFDERFNESRFVPLPDDVASECRVFYSEVYEYCRIAFPETDELWSYHSAPGEAIKPAGIIRGSRG